MVGKHKFFFNVHEGIVGVVVGSEVVEGFGRGGELLNEDDELGQADDFAQVACRCVAVR